MHLDKRQSLGGGIKLGVELWRAPFDAPKKMVAGFGTLVGSS